MDIQELLSDLEQNSYTIPGLLKEPVIDLKKVIELIRLHIEGVVLTDGLVIDVDSQAHQQLKNHPMITITPKTIDGWTVEDFEQEAQELEVESMLDGSPVVYDRSKFGFAMDKIMEEREIGYQPIDHSVIAEYLNKYCKGSL